MTVAIDATLDRRFGAPNVVGSVYDPKTQLAGSFQIFRDGYAHTKYKDAIYPLTDRDNWVAEAKLDWHVEEASCWYEIGEGDDALMHPFQDRKVLYRNDTNAPLAVVGPRYKPVQPASILDFFGEITDQHGFKLEVAGEALGGRRIFGMAKCPQECELPGGDWLLNYLIMVTHNDGTGATRCFFSSIRPWCMNQMPLLVNNRSGVNVSGSVARQTHSTEFDVRHMADQLAHINDDWAAFEESLLKLQNTKVDDDTALQYMARVFGKDDDKLSMAELAQDRYLQRVMLTYNVGEGQRSCRGTAWGLVNGVTRYLDHDSTTRTVGTCIEKNWMGAGRAVKQVAFQEALKLAA